MQNFRQFTQYKPPKEIMNSVSGSDYVQSEGSRQTVPSAHNNNTSRKNGNNNNQYYNQVAGQIGGQTFDQMNASSQIQHQQQGQVHRHGQVQVHGQRQQVSSQMQSQSQSQVQSQVHSQRQPHIQLKSHLHPQVQQPQMLHSHLHQNSIYNSLENQQVQSQQHSSNSQIYNNNASKHMTPNNHAIDQQKIISSLQSHSSHPSQLSPHTQQQPQKSQQSQQGQQLKSQLQNQQDSTPSQKNNPLLSHLTQLKFDTPISIPNESSKKKNGIKPPPEQNLPPLKRKRAAVSKACWHCRKAHAKCSDNRPCTRCIKKNIPCVENEPDEERDGCSHATSSMALMTRMNLIPNPLNSSSFNSEPNRSSTPISSFPIIAHPSPTAAPENAFIQNLPVISSTQHNQYPIYNNSYITEEVLENVANTLPLQNDMTISLTQTIKQQAQLIQQLIERQNQNPEGILSEKMAFKENPFVEALNSNIPCALWKEDSENKHHELLFANDEFYRLLECEPSEIVGYKFGMDDIPNFILGKFGKNVNRNLSSKMQKFEHYIRKLSQKLKASFRNNPQKFQALDAIYFLKRKIILNQTFIESALVRKNGFIYQSYKPIDVFNDEVCINDYLLPKTFEINNMEDITDDMFSKMIHRVSTAIGTSDSTSFCNSPFSRSQASPSPSPVTTPIHGGMTEDELFPSISLDEIQFDGLDFYLL